MWSKKFLSLILLVSFLSPVFIFPSPVSSQAEELCGGIIPEPGKKFIKIRVTNNANNSGGQPGCISVPENTTSLNFQDLLRARGENGAGLVSQTWNENSTEYQLKPCLERERDIQEWRTMGTTPLSQAVITMKNDCAVVNSISRNFEPWRGRPFKQFTNELLNDDVPDYPTFPPRWKIAFQNETKYIFVIGEEKVTAQDNEILNICRQQLFQQIPRCNTAANPGLQAFIAANNLQIALNSLGAGTDCETAFRQCVADVTKGTDVRKDPFKDDPRYQTPNNYQGPLPDCSFSYDGCRNVNDILVFFIKIGQALFQVIGTFAFVMFIYGGFTIILSMGNSEKVRKGQEVLVAAVVGILIAFSAYLIIDFVLDALQVGKDFRTIGNDQTSGSGEQQVE